MTISGYGLGPPGSDDSVTFFPLSGGTGTLAINGKVASDKEITATVPVESAAIIANGGNAVIDVGANDVYSNRVDYSYKK